jgi:hypothetical protein
MGESKKSTTRFIQSLLKKFLPNSLYPFFMFFRTIRSFKKRIKIGKKFNRFSNNLPKINDNEFKVNSQNNEDGIIEYIFKIVPNNKYFVEIGFGHYECNGINLVKNNWHGRFIDYNTAEVLALRSSLIYYFPNSKTDVVNAKITKDNVNNLVFSDRANKDIDFFSLDIDGNDYWVLKAFDLSKTKVICCEYNHWLGSNSKLTMKYNNNFNSIDSGVYGASLLAFTEMLKEKGFLLVAIDSSGTNAFFVNKKYSEHFEIICPIKNFISIGRFYNETQKKKIYENINQSNSFTEV